MKTIGHHCCKKDGGEAFVLQESPFYAEHSPEDNKFQFLGSGYYFWDNNIDLAKVWGKTHYNNDYYVIKINLDLNQDNCYDLVGNRSHQIHFIKLLEEFAEETGISKLEKWSVNQWIEMIKELKKESPEIFPWKMVRAVDLLNHERYSRAQKMIKFIEEKNNYTIINPKIVICVFNKEDLNLKSKEIVVSL